MTNVKRQTMPESCQIDFHQRWWFFGGLSLTTGSFVFIRITHVIARLQPISLKIASSKDTQRLFVSVSSSSDSSLFPLLSVT